ncbi:MAG TPA: hypothetical protein VKG01_06980 [Thermoanaerobaculia bacterium]|nr:hypothetical protein [Thermoanaerobaculia bacterium]
MLMALSGNCLPANGETADREEWQPRFLNARRDGLVQTALEFAKAKLSNASCQDVFLDFRNPSGDALASTLEALGETPATYLALIQFYDATGKSLCRADRLAITVPGSRVVYLCGSAFRDLVRRAPGRAAAVLIHEELHSLGLGENPPSPDEITARVVDRCGP